MSYGMNDGQQSRIPMRLILAVILALVTVISYYSKGAVNPITGRKQHIDMSVKQEIALGLQATPQMESQYGGEVRDPVARGRVESVGRRILENSDAGKTPYQFDFHLLNDPNTINAFALPGGQVFMTYGLFKRLSTDGELAGVLGHEIGHVCRVTGPSIWPSSNSRRVSPAPR